MKCPKCRASLVVPAESEVRAGAAAGEAGSSGTSDDPFGDLSELVVYDDEIVYETDEATGGQNDTDRSSLGFDPRRVAVLRWMLYAHAVLLALVAVGAFVAGYAIGNALRDETGAVVVRPQPVEIGGKLTWEAVTGEIADKEAVVIALPEGNDPETKIPAVDLVPGKPALKEDHPAIKKIFDLGGDYARSGEGGHFHLQLVPGTYLVLFLSRNAEREAGANPAPDDVAAAGKFFTPPQAIFGNQKYKRAKIEVKEGTRLDHYFGESGK